MIDKPPSGHLGLVALIVAMGLYGVLSWIFAHPTREEWRLYGLMFLWFLLIELLRESFNSLEYRLKDIQRRLDAMSRTKGG